jgi:hypothetical protein
MYVAFRVGCCAFADLHVLLHMLRLCALTPCARLSALFNPLFSLFLGLASRPRFSASLLSLLLALRSTAS